LEAGLASAPVWELASAQAELGSVQESVSALESAPVSVLVWALVSASGRALEPAVAQAQRSD
jgi:hypothetical protein